VTFAASSGQAPILPVSWTVPAWFVNKSTGSDANACTTALTACATKQEIWVHRWGMSGSGSANCPRFQQTTTLEQDASDTDNTDPIYPCAAMEKGGSFIIKGGTVAGTAAVFTRSAAKNTAAGTNALLAGSFSAGSPAANVLVTNTTAAKASRAWIYKTAGGANWNLSQPMVPLTVPAGVFTIGAGAEINTWATNDTVTLSSPIAINVVSTQGVIADFDGGYTNALYLYNMTIYDPAGVGADDFVLGSQTHVVECAIQRSMGNTNFVATNVGPQYVYNSTQETFGTFGGLGEQSDPSFAGGIMGGSSTFAGSPQFSTDIIMGNTPSGNDTLVLGADMASNVYLDTSVVVRSGELVLNSGVIYGSGTNTIVMNGSSHFFLATGGNFVTAFTAPGLVTGIQINGLTTANSLCTATINAAITLTPAHLDAACGAAGFGSKAYNWAGASVANF
jgi:hypothetical protein